MLGSFGMPFQITWSQFRFHTSKRKLIFFIGCYHEFSWSLQFVQFGPVMWCILSHSTKCFSFADIRDMRPTEWLHFLAFTGAAAYTGYAIHQVCCSRLCTKSWYITFDTEVFSSQKWLILFLISIKRIKPNILTLYDVIWLHRNRSHKILKIENVYGK